MAKKQVQTIRCSLDREILVRLDEWRAAYFISRSAAIKVLLNLSLNNNPDSLLLASLGDIAGSGGK